MRQCWTLLDVIRQAEHNAKALGPSIKRYVEYLRNACGPILLVFYINEFESVFVDINQCFSNHVNYVPKKIL